MPRFEIIDAKRQHLGPIARSVRHEHARLLGLLGIDVHRKLVQSFQDSVYCKTYLVDGKPVAIWGIMGHLAATSGRVWLLIAQDVLHYKLRILKESRRELRALLGHFRRLETTVLVGDEKARRLAAVLGFRPVSMACDGEYVPLVLEHVEEEEQDGPQPFIVYSLPRSRSKWLSVFLSYSDHVCHHDLPVEVHSVSDLRDRLSIEGHGTVETGLTTAWGLLDRAFPKARIVVVRRPLDEVKASLARHGWNYGDGELEAHVRRLEEISCLPNALTVDYSALGDERICAKVFEHCLRRPFDRDWWLNLKDQRLEIDMPERERVLHRDVDKINSFFRQVLAKSFPVTIGCENYEDFRRDGIGLFADHYAEAGSFDGLPLDVNLKMFKAMEDQGALLIIGARCAGSLVGYIVFLIAESLENQTVLMGYQNIFYVRKEFRGIGLKLHAAARMELKRIGIKHLIFRAGIRASGKKQEHLFKRLGAQYIGVLYSLPLGEMTWGSPQPE